MVDAPTSQYARFSTPVGLAIDSSGFLYVVEISNFVRLVDTATTRVSQAITYFNGNYGIHASSDSSAVFLSNGHAVKGFGAALAPTATANPALPSSGFDQPKVE